MIAAPIALCALFTALPSPVRRYDPLKMSDLDAIAPVLRRSVAVVEIKVPVGRDRSIEEEREGLGVVITPRRLATASALVEGTTRARVRGPSGQVEVVVLRLDRERRVAILESSSPLSEIGLSAATLAPQKSVQADRAVFVLLHPESEQGVLSGFVTHAGDEDWLEGFPRVSLKLAGGTPVFDERARLIGIARAVLGDPDPHLLVPVWRLNVRTASTSDSPKAGESEETRPWWAK